MEYMSAKDIQELIPGIGYKKALEIINQVQEKMKKEGYLIPGCKKKIALTWMIKRELGIRK